MFCWISIKLKILLAVFIVTIDLVSHGWNVIYLHEQSICLWIWNKILLQLLHFALPSKRSQNNAINRASMFFTDTKHYTDTKRYDISKASAVCLKRLFYLYRCNLFKCITEAIPSSDSGFWKGYAQEHCIFSSSFRAVGVIVFYHAHIVSHNYLTITFSRIYGI